MKKEKNFENITFEGTKEKEKFVKIDISKSYQFESEDFEIDVTSVRYSNQSYIQVMGQDVFIDFLELPGIKKEGKMILNATRIYLTHVQAKKLAMTLGNVLENTYKAGQMETYKPTE